MNYFKMNYKWVWAAWIVALVSMMGSLYFSEALMFEPCKLCWFQRICMYPLTLFLGFAYFKKQRALLVPSLTLACIGAPISLFHYLEEKIPRVGEIAPCRVGIPCNEDYINWLGFITIPLLALTGFTLIILFLSFHLKKEPPFCLKKAEKR